MTLFICGLLTGIFASTIVFSLCRASAIGEQTFKCHEVTGLSQLYTALILVESYPRGKFTVKRGDFYFLRLLDPKTKEIFEIRRACKVET